MKLEALRDRLRTKKRTRTLPTKEGRKKVYKLPCVDCGKFTVRECIKCKKELCQHTACALPRKHKRTCKKCTADKFGALLDQIDPKESEETKWDCTVRGCGGPSVDLARGLCQKHYDEKEDRANPHGPCDQCDESRRTLKRQDGEMRCVVCRQHNNRKKKYEPTSSGARVDRPCIECKNVRKTFWYADDQYRCRSCAQELKHAHEAEMRARR